MAVFKEVYEVTGSDELKRARAFAAKRDAAHKTQWEVVRSFGAEGYRPGYGGRIKSLLFAKTAEVPAGLRKVGTDQGRIEYQPSLNTKAGKAIQATLSAAPIVEDWGRFANEFDWKGRSPMDGQRGLIYHASGVQVLRPRQRFFLTYPRELKDGWKAPKGLTLVRESDMLRAIEDHNNSVKD